MISWKHVLYIVENDSLPAPPAKVARSMQKQPTTEASSFDKGALSESDCDENYVASESDTERMSEVAPSDDDTRPNCSRDEKTPTTGNVTKPMASRMNSLNKSDRQKNNILTSSTDGSAHFQSQPNSNSSKSLSSRVDRKSRTPSESRPRPTCSDRSATRSDTVDQSSSSGANSARVAFPMSETSEYLKCFIFK